MTRVLIVDDEEIARISLADILKLEGYTIRTAANGQAAIDLVQKEPFDVMILDLKMPGLSGMDVLAALEDRLNDLKVIVLTAHGSMDTAIQALRYRVHDYMLKPVDPAHVIDCIEGAMVSKETIIDETPSTGEQRFFQLAEGIMMDSNKRLILWADDSINLTPTESRLMIILTESIGKMITHAELVKYCQGYNVSNEEAAKILRPVVSRLRQKMSVLPGWTEWIKNIRGAGYVLELPGS